MKNLFFCAVLLFAMIAQAKPTEISSLEQEISTLRNHWAKVKYLTPKEEKEIQFESLVKKAEILTQTYPDNAAFSAWYGTILSSYASFKGGHSALSKLKQARKLLERSIQLDPKVEGGLAHAILGAVYYRVSAKPIGFKDLQKAQTHLLSALAINPDNMDANFFYGEYLLKVGDEEAAHHYLLAAFDAPVRKGMNVADNGRREEILNLLATLKRG